MIIQSPVRPAFQNDLSQGFRVFGVPLSEGDTIKGFMTEYVDRGPTIVFELDFADGQPGLYLASPIESDAVESAAFGFRRALNPKLVDEYGAEAKKLMEDGRWRMLADARTQ